MKNVNVDSGCLVGMGKEEKIGHAIKEGNISNHN